MTADTPDPRPVDLGEGARLQKELAALQSDAGPTGGYSWACPECGTHVTSWYLPPPLAASPAAPAGLDVEKAANDVRHGGHHLDSYWEGFNDGVDALEARLRAASQPSEDGPAE